MSPLRPRRSTPLHSPLRRIAIAACAIALSGSADAADVSDAWARSTIAGQTASVVYLTLTSATHARLLGATSPAAAVVQVHEMSMQGTTMKMRPVESVDLPAGKPVELKPGGLHLMLMDLRKPLAPGDKLPLTLRIEGADGQVAEQAVSVEVRDAAPATRSH